MQTIPLPITRKKMTLNEAKTKLRQALKEDDTELIVKLSCDIINMMWFDIDNTRESFFEAQNLAGSLYCLSRILITSSGGAGGFGGNGSDREFRIKLPVQRPDLYICDDILAILNAWYIRDRYGRELTLEDQSPQTQRAIAELLIS